MVRQEFIGIVINLVGNFLLTLGTNWLKLYHLQKKKSGKVLIQDTQPSVNELAKADDLGAPGDQVRVRFQSSVLENNKANEENIENGISDQDTDLRTPPRLKERIRMALSGWIMPLVFVVLGSVIIFVSFAYAAQSILAALSSSQFVFNVMFKRCLFGDKPTWNEAGSTLIIVLGNLIIVSSAAISDPQHDSIDGVLELYKRPAFLLFFALVLLLAGISHILFLKLRHRNSPVNICSKKVRLNPNTLTPILYAATSAMPGAQGMTMAKSLAELIRYTFSGSGNAFSHPETYAFALLLVVALAWWMFRVNKALILFSENAAIIPVLQVNWLVFSVLGGGIYFKEFYTFSYARLSVVYLGIFIIVFGVISLARSVAERVEEREPSVSHRISRRNSEIFWPMPGPHMLIDESDEDKPSMKQTEEEKS